MKAWVSTAFAANVTFLAGVNDAGAIEWLTVGTPDTLEALAAVVGEEWDVVWLEPPLLRLVRKPAGPAGQGGA
jgi:hypothetical protein